MEDRSTGDERHLSADRETVRGWAQEHDAAPVRTSEGRFELRAESTMADDQERAEWDAFFDALEEGDHVVVYHGEGATEPLEVYERDAIVDRTELDREEFEERLVEGETLTSHVTETTVVESVVVEEIDVESELVDREIVDVDVVDVSFVDRELSTCDLVADEGADDRELFGEEWYLGTFREYSGEASTEPTSPYETREEFPYHVEADVDETWTVTRDLLERFTVESRITDTDVSEADTVEDYDVDVHGLHRSIVESGIVDVEGPPDEVLTEYDVESSLAEADRIRTHFERQRRIEDEVVSHNQLRADVSGGEIREMETVSSRDLPIGEATADGEMDAAAESGVEGDASAGGAVGLTEDDVGKDVVDATGEDVGTVTAIDADEDRIYVEPHQSVAEKIKAALGWEEEEEYPLRAEHVARVTDDRIELKGQEELPGEA